MGSPTISIPRLPAVLTDPAAWRAAARVEINQFHAKSGTPRPRASARCFHDGRNIMIGFSVVDHHVPARYTEFMSPVWTDSCVEFFVRPTPQGGYFNFEMNLLGALFAHYIEDWTKTPTGFARSTPLTAQQCCAMTIQTSFNQPSATEIPGPLEWFLQVQIPLEVMEINTGSLGDLSGQHWQGNFYKCADDSSRPHWGAWADIGVELNFHKPHRFGTLRFE